MGGGCASLTTKTLTTEAARACVIPTDLGELVVELVAWQRTHPIRWGWQRAVVLGVAV